jgi:hypothetical protein
VDRYRLTYALVGRTRLALVGAREHAFWPCGRKTIGSPRLMHQSSELQLALGQSEVQPYQSSFSGIDLPAQNAPDLHDLPQL